MKGRIFQVMTKHTYFNPCKIWDELSNYKTKIGPSCLGLSFEFWAELAWADFYVGRVGIGRVGLGPSCPHGKRYVKQP